MEAVENISKGTLVKRKTTAKKIYIRTDYNRSTKRYILENYFDISDTFEVKKGTLLSIML